MAHLHVIDILEYELPTPKVRVLSYQHCKHCYVYNTGDVDIRGMITMMTM